MGVILFDLEEIPLPNFVNALDAWYTVFICVTQDGWADLLETFLNTGKEQNYDKLLVIYLLIAVSAGGFVFANLIVAVIVTNLEMAVKEFRDEKAMSDNPLEFHKDYSASEVEILPVHELLANNNTALLAQRPFKIPSLKKFSLRRLQAYIALIVALEHNMLEAEIIHLDLEKVMAVILTTMAQLQQLRHKGNPREATKMPHRESEHNILEKN
ncbi:unnamed protein product [Orchesella dallaii]|uniref:Ion transport domain-containing protein n=1 Tax=Orchesella dallaii TaxID=48710 RepID=A0ABP1QED5_9HEXA